MDERGAEPAAGPQHPCALGDRPHRVVHVVQAHERHDQGNGAVDERQGGGVAEEHTLVPAGLLARVASVGELSSPSSQCPAGRSSRPTRPSPQPTSSVSRPACGTSGANAGQLNRVWYTSCPAVRTQVAHSAARRSHTLLSRPVTAGL